MCLGGRKPHLLNDLYWSAAQIYANRIRLNNVHFALGFGDDDDGVAEWTLASNEFIFRNMTRSANGELTLELRAAGKMNLRLKLVFTVDREVIIHADVQNGFGSYTLEIHPYEMEQLPDPFHFGTVTEDVEHIYSCLLEFAGVDLASRTQLRPTFTSVDDLSLMVQL